MSDTTCIVCDRRPASYVAMDENEPPDGGWLLANQPGMKPDWCRRCVAVHQLVTCRQEFERLKPVILELEAELASSGSAATATGDEAATT